MDNKMHPRIKILVACHKADPNIRHDDIYMPIQVGKALPPELDLGFQCDNTGDTISEKNGSYCELTALYWAWKNLKDVDYIGLCHYRRYFDFSKNNSALKPIKSDEFHLLKNNVFAPIINRNEVFLPSFTYLPHSVGMDFQKTVLTEDMYILYKILEKYYPEYLSVFSNYMTGNHRTGFNMFLMSFALFRDYATWLFDILGKVEDRIKLSEYISYKRVFGYMGEFLLPIYCIKNLLKIKEHQVMFVTDEKIRYRGNGITQMRNFLNQIAFNIGRLGQNNELHDSYWEMYLKADGIKI